MSVPHQIATVMAETGMGELQATRHLRDRKLAQRLSVRPRFVPFTERIGA